MQEGVLRWETENLEWNIFEGPDIQGSRRMVKVWEGRPGEGGKGDMGAKVRRNDASLFRCLTVKDIFESGDEKIEKGCKAHGSWIRKVRPQGWREWEASRRFTRFVRVDR